GDSRTFGGGGSTETISQTRIAQFHAAAHDPCIGNLAAQRQWQAGPHGDQGHGEDMKPAGAIPTDFLSSSAELRIGGEDISRIIAQAGDTPLFAYDAEVILRRVERFRAAMHSEVGLHYAVKANPYVPILTQFASLVDGFDVASGGEMD